jgi:hypothetical protein
MSKAKKIKAAAEGQAKLCNSAKSKVQRVMWETQRHPQAEPTQDLGLTEDQLLGWPVAKRPQVALKPRPGWHAGEGSGGVPVVAVAAFGLDEDRLRLVLKQIKRQQRSKGPFVPLFLTDATQHALLRRSEVLFEYFPEAVYLAEANAALFSKRFNALWKKWRPSYLIDLGKPGLLRARLEDYDTYYQSGLDPNTVFDPRNEPIQPSVPAVTDVAALKAEYLTKGLDRAADTFVLYRILGNDLPPRHEEGQTLKNLRFILENEPELMHCEKRWVVNRIADAEQEQAVIALLEQYDQPFLHIPFDLDEYRNVEWDFESFPQMTFFLNGRYANMYDHDKLRAEAHARRHKNRYVMNNNGARNAALRDGRGRAKWVLPWDGNCFLTKSAWSEVVQSVTNAPHLKYFTVPMSRTTDNADLLKRGYNPEAVDEPQLLFRNDATEEFDEDFHYGRRPKVELFWRLGIPGVWDAWRGDSWDLPRPTRAAEAGDCGQAGWVARLHSGRNDLEASSDQVTVQRGMARSEAIVSLIDALDRRALAAKFDAASLKAYDEPILASLKLAPVDAAKGMIYTRLQQEADLALQRGPYSVVDKTVAPPSGDKHDYFHPAPYWWPNPHTKSGYPAIRRDGERSPGTRLYEPESARYDRTRLQRLFDDTTILALAGSSSGNTEYHQHAAGLVRHWFIDPRTRMNPHLEYAQVRTSKGEAKGTARGLIEMKDLYFFLDAVRLLERSGTFAEADKTALHEWMRDYLDWLLESEQGQEECRAANNHGTCYDLQVAAIAAYLGDVDVLATTFRRSRERIAGQFSKNGSQKHELTRTQTEHYCAFNLQSWINLANLAERCGDTLWHYEGKEGRNLAAGFHWMLSKYCQGKWPYEQIAAFDKDRYLPIIYCAQARYTSNDTANRALGFLRKPFFFPHDGIMPFWMLSSSLQSSGAAEGGTFARLISKAEDRACSGISGGRQKRASPKALEKRLWGGYPDQAAIDLNAVQHSPAYPDADRCFAAWTLGRWLSFNGEFAEALPKIREARDFDQSEKRRYILSEANCMIELGRAEEARAMVEGQLEFHPDDPNLFFQIANTFQAQPGTDDPEVAAAKLSWINKVYLTNGLATIQKKQADKPLSFFNITGEDVVSARPDDVRDTKVSVIMPVYNGAETIGIAIKSMLAQTWSNLQIIVVDDASTDATCDVVKSIAATDSRVELVELKTNGGAYIARNTGMELAEGDYVTVHDSDDWSHPQKVEMQFRQLNSSRNAMAVLSRWMRVHPDLFAIGFWRPDEHLMSINLSSLLFRKDLLKEIGPWDTVRAGADNEFGWRFRTRYGDDALTTTSRNLPLALSLIRPDSLTRQSATHVQTVYHGIRRDYQRTYRRWQDSMPPEELRLEPVDPKSRVFPAPRPMLESPYEPAAFKSVFIADYTQGGHNIDAISEIVVQAASEGDGVGIFHWPDYENTADGAFHPVICELLDTFKIEQISAYQDVQAETLVLCDALLARYPIAGLPDFGAKQVDVLCPYAGSQEMIFDPRRRRMPTKAELEDLFSTPCRLLHFEPAPPANS